MNITQSDHKILMRCFGRILLLAAAFSSVLLQEKLNIRLVPPLYPVPYCQPLKTGDLVFQRKENFQPPTLPLKI